MITCYQTPNGESLSRDGVVCCLLFVLNSVRETVTWFVFQNLIYLA